MCEDLTTPTRKLLNDENATILGFKIERYGNMARFVINVRVSTPPVPCQTCGHV